MHALPAGVLGPVLLAVAAVAICLLAFVGDVEQVRATALFGGGTSGVVPELAARGGCVCRGWQGQCAAEV